MQTKPKTKRGQADLVARLVKATGLSREGVYRCLRLKTRPKNARAAAAWEKVVG